MPSLEGAALLMSGEPAGALVRTILALSLLQEVAVYGVARAWFGSAGAFAAAAGAGGRAGEPNILGWHGLANVGALAIVVLILAQLGAWLAGELDRRGELGSRSRCSGSRRRTGSRRCSSPGRSRLCS